MLLSRKEIINLIQTKRVRFNPPLDIKNQVGMCSIDLRLGLKFSKFRNLEGVTVMPSISESSSFFDREERKVGDKVEIGHDELVLAQTYEEVFLPNNIAAMVEGRSTLARWGLSAHVTAPLIEPTFYGNITLEILNHGKTGLNLVVGQDKVCQLILYKISSPISRKVGEAFGRYKGQKSPEPEPYGK